ncbi:hypothetical protein ElyMa_000599000, partial [Elysia marginata]
MDRSISKHPYCDTKRQKEIRGMNSLRQKCKIRRPRNIQSYESNQKRPNYPQWFCSYSTFRQNAYTTEAKTQSFVNEYSKVSRLHFSKRRKSKSFMTDTR